MPKFSAKNVATGIELSPLYQNSRDCVVSNVILNLSSSLTIRYYFSYSSISMRKRKNLLMFLILPGIKKRRGVIYDDITVSPDYIGISSTDR